ncbi:MAG TPA: phytoene desaturase family protein [Casimicrobiaceae bacterium]
MHSERVLVVGAGIGGLVTAVELASRGEDVMLLERADGPGGKMREVQVDDRRLDAGPTVLTMRWVFDELFDAVGATSGEQLSLRRSRTLARHAWSSDGLVPARLDLFTDLEQSVQAIGEFAGAADARGYREFCVRAQRVYQTLEHSFLRASRPNPLTLAGRVGLRRLPDLARISPFSTLWDALGQHFRDPRLRQLFGRYATYCGSSPFTAPATLMLVAHVEREGVWLVDGGMHQIARTLAAMALRRGASIRYGTHVNRIRLRAGRVCGVDLASGETLDARAVVFNGDVGALADGLLGDDTRGAVRRQPRASRSLSAVTWNLVAQTSGLALLRHNVFFSNDYAAEFDQLCVRSRLPTDPTVYVCAQDRTDDSDAVPPERERLLCIVNAPPTGDGPEINRTELAKCEERTFLRLSRCGLQVQRHPGNTLRTTQANFERLFPATGGALYGQASQGWRAAFTRPCSRSQIPGLYLTGGSVHPGPGVPMAALSGRLAAASLLQDAAQRRVSTTQSAAVATHGGISTP